MKCLVLSIHAVRDKLMILSEGNKDEKEQERASTTQKMIQRTREPKDSHKHNRISMLLNHTIIEVWVNIAKRKFRMSFYKKEKFDNRDQQDLKRVTILDSHLRKIIILETRQIQIKASARD